MRENMTQERTGCKAGTCMLGMQAHEEGGCAREHDGVQGRHLHVAADGVRLLAGVRRVVRILVGVSELVRHEARGARHGIPDVGGCVAAGQAGGDLELVEVDPHVHRGRLDVADAGGGGRGVGGVDDERRSDGVHARLDGVGVDLQHAVARPAAAAEARHLLAEVSEVVGDREGEGVVLVALARARGLADRHDVFVVHDPDVDLELAGVRVVPSQRHDGGHAGLDREGRAGARGRDLVLLRGVRVGLGGLVAAERQVVAP